MAQDELCLDGEEWRGVVGYEPFYEVNRLGVVRGKRNVTEGSRYSSSHRNGSVLKQFLSKSKRVYVLLCVEGKETKSCVDEIVLSAFTRPSNDGEAAYHLDRNLENNSADNLMWVSRESLSDFWIYNNEEVDNIVERLPDESWANVVGFEGLFKVSSRGRVVSVDKVVNYKNKPTVLYGKLIKQYNTKNGYKRVNLVKNGKNHAMLVHRLVAESFLRNDENLPEVDHIDANQSNNSIENIRWVSREQNIQHMIDMGHLNRVQKYHESNSHINEYDGRCRPVMRSDGVKYKSVIEAATANGCSERFLREHLEGKSHTCMGYVFTPVACAQLNN